MKPLRLKTLLLFGLFLTTGLSIESTTAHAADLKGLKAIFKEGFDSLYEPRFCGRNIERLIQKAIDQRVDLSGAYVLKIEGAGFLETSGFYTRTLPNDREMLGYFHVVLVAEDQVFDFDLYEPLVLETKKYIRLQFTPARNPTLVFGNPYDARKELEWWTVTRIELKEYLGSSKKTWTKKLGAHVDLDAVLALPRPR